MVLDEDLLAVTNGDGNINRVLELIQQGANVQCSRNDGTTPLYYAAGKGYEHICKTLLENGARINSVKNNGWSVLMNAVYNGRVSIVRLLLSNGADEKLKAADNQTLLDVALNGSFNEEICLLLIEHGIDVNNVQNKETPLHWACRNRKTELVERLLHKGASMEVLDSQGRYPVFYAKNNGYQEIVKMIEKDFPIWLRVHHAALQGNLKECQALVGQGALVGSSQHGFYCPLAGASKKGHIDIVQFLLEKLTIINYGNDNERNPLYLAVKKGHTDIASLLMAHGAYPNIKVNGDTLLHVATRKNNEELVRLLLEKEVNPNIKNKDGWTPLHYAIVNENEALANCLIKHSSNTNLATNKLETPLHLACESGNQNILQILVKNGANPKLLNSQKEKPLDIVERFQSETEMEFEKNLKVVQKMKELLTQRSVNKRTRINEETAIKRSSERSKSSAEGDRIESDDDLDSDATVDFESIAIDDDTTINGILESGDIEELNEKLTQISTLILEINDLAIKLELKNTDLTLETDILSNLNRKIRNNKLLKRMKAGESDAETAYEEALQELTRKLDETKQKETKIADEVKIIQTGIKMLRNQAKNLYREIARFFH